jgi:hypothetical protein
MSNYILKAMYLENVKTSYNLKRPIVFLYEVVGCVWISSS